MGLPTSLLESLRGATHPRIQVAPPAAYTLGPEAAELSARAGLPLFPYQRNGLDIMLSVRDDGQWACFEYCEMCSRQNGKTAGIFAPRALFGLLLLGERLIMWSAHEYKTAMESFRLFRRMIYVLGTEIKPNLFDVDGVPIKVNNTNSEESFERLDIDSRVKFIARSKSSGRGFTGDTNLVDEAFALTPEHQEALGPTTLAVENPQIGYASSPPLDGLSGGPLFGLRKRALAGGDDSLGYRDWGIEGDLDELHLVDLDDRAHWCGSNPGLGFKLNEQKMLHNRRMLSDRGFGRECLGLWPRQIDLTAGVIDRTAWARLADPESQIEGGMVFALDASPGLASGAIGVAGYRADRIPHIEITGRDGVLDHRRGVDWMVPRAVEINEQWHPVWVLAPDGPAGALLSDLRTAGIEPELVTTRELAQACGSLAAAVVAPERDKLRHLGQRPLTSAVAAAKKRDIGDGAWAFGRRASDQDISPLIAGTLALHGLAVYGELDAAANVW
jgi:hypothetical protein